jgi:hypothetical protein
VALLSFQLSPPDGDAGIYGYAGTSFGRDVKQTGQDREEVK